VHEDGERMLIPCEGGPCRSRLVRYPPPLEVDEPSGVYVLAEGRSLDEPEYRYVFVEHTP
jgi:hypothetical protein